MVDIFSIRCRQNIVYVESEVIGSDESTIKITCMLIVEPVQFSENLANIVCMMFL